MIQIDGSYLEGGGQIIRTALAFSALTNKPFKIGNIRTRRPNPGLKSQHLYCVKSMQELCDAQVEGAELGSMHLKFFPRKLCAKSIDIDIGTAGSITLLLQSLLPACMFASRPIKLKIRGGTDVSWSPSFDYFNNVLLPQLQRFAKIEAKLLMRGYYPKGGGNVEIKINPMFKLKDFENFEQFHSHLSQNIKPYSLTEQHNLMQIKAVSHAASNLEDARVAQRQAHAAQVMLAKIFRVPIKITSEYQHTQSIGSGITSWAIFSKNKEDIDETNPIRLGSDALGEQGKKAEIVGGECAMSLSKEIESKAPVDIYLSDQILSFMALCPDSKIKVSDITNHCKTNISTISLFMGDIFNIDEENRIIKTEQ